MKSLCWVNYYCKQFFRVQNVLRALVDKFTVKFTSTTLQDTVGYDIYKIYEDLFLPLHERHNNLLMEGIQTEKLCKIRLKAADEETMGMDAKRLWMPFLATCTVSSWTTKFLDDHRVFYQEALSIFLCLNCCSRWLCRL